MTEQQPKPEKALTPFDIKIMSGFLSAAALLTSVVIYFNSQDNRQERNTEAIRVISKNIEKIKMDVDEVKSTHKARAEIDRFHDRTLESHANAIRQNANDIHTRTFK